MGTVTSALVTPALDTPEVRKARGAFFTPEPIARFVTEWAIRSTDDRVFEPSCGDAEFLEQAVTRLRDLGAEGEPEVFGVEIHADSAADARARIRAVGGKPKIVVSDFFLLNPNPVHSVAIGNPPFIRYQDFTGESRTRSRAAALSAGVPLSGLASSWAAFAVHTALFLETGGRMGLVLPAELLSVNYAASVRKFLFDRFRTVDLVTFAEQVFPEAEVDVVLLLADGFDEGPAGHATVYQAQNAESLGSVLPAQRWAPADPAAKWTSSLMNSSDLAAYSAVVAGSDFVDLEVWGDTTLGMVTGNNKYFALSPERVHELGLKSSDLVRLSPPGSAHLRGLELSADMMTRLGRKGKGTWLFRPSGQPSAAAREYIEAGETTGVDLAYKCRVRKTWWRVPLVRPADLLFTCMNSDTARITTNSVGAHHLNSVHGVYLREEYRELGRELLPVASLNSMTLLGAEAVGRAYGGGILKLEPREADVLPVPSPDVVAKSADRLREIRPAVARKLQAGKLMEAVSMVDEVLLKRGLGMTDDTVAMLRRAHAELTERRATRSQSGR